MKKNLLAFILILAVIAPSCAAGRGRGATAQAAKPSDKAAARSSSLEEVMKGLSGFEKRASRYSADEWNFVLGYAHLSSQRWAEAEQYLAKADGKLPALEDHILYWRAIASNRIGKYDQAMELLGRLDSDYRDSVFFREADREVATALAGQKRYSEAVVTLTRMLPGVPDTEKPDLKRQIAATLMAGGDGDRAAGYVREMALSSSGDRELSQLNDLISELKSRFHIDVAGWLDDPAQQFALAQTFIAGSQWADAAARLEKLLKGKRLEGAQRSRAKWMLARCYRFTHRYDEAIALMEELLKDSSASGFDDEILSTLATTYMKKNDYAKALSIRQRMLSGLPSGSRGAAQIAYKIAFLHMDEGKYAEAISLWERMAGMKGAGKQGIMARWYIAWCYYMKGDYDAAISVFDGLLRSGAKAEGIDDRVQYWKARALAASGQREAAREIYRRIESDHPNGYYGEIARRQIEGAKENVAEFAAVRDRWAGSSQGWDPREPASGDSTHMHRAVLLDKMGLHEEVGRELRAANSERNGAPAEEVMWLASRNFAHEISYAIARGRYRDVLDSPPGHSSFDHFIWEQAYPKAYDPVMERLSVQEHVDPMLAWSIMLNESTFKPRVVSPAGAVGLMQLMPTTAGKICKERGGEGDPSRADLTDPTVNISYGVAYLGKLAGLFPNNPVAMIAAYNAGEEAVGRWLKNGSFDHIEEWIEEIPYDETNLYVKKVLNSYWKYQRLYGKSTELK